MEDFTMNLIAFDFIGYIMGTEDLHRGKQTARLQDRKTARLHDCKTIKFQNRRTA
jgi:hypothetical protein